MNALTVSTQLHRTDPGAGAEAKPLSGTISTTVPKERAPRSKRARVAGLRPKLDRLTNFAGIRVQVEYLPTDQLRPADNVTRRHTRVQLRKLAQGIAEHGFIVPVTVYGANIIASGHARWEAAKLAGLSEIPTIRLEHLTDEQARLFAIADNKLTEGGTWDLDALRIEFAAIQVTAPTIELDSSGFTIGERDVLVGRHRVADLADLDDLPEAARDAPVSRLGDIWVLGRHRVVCGDATDPDVITAVVDGKLVRAVVSDPPFNVKIAGNVSGLGKAKHPEFAMASGEMTKSEFVEFLRRSIATTQPHLIDGALLFLFQDWRHIADLVAAAEACDLDQLNLLIWAKTNAGMGTFYRSAHELIGLFKHGNGKHTNNVELGRYGRNRTNVLNYPGVNTFTKGRAQALALHPTVKPVALLADLILDASGPGEIILDPFGGSGSTLIAAEKTDRTAYLVELSPVYVDVIVKRFQEATGMPAVHAVSGRTFAELRDELAATLESSNA